LELFCDATGMVINVIKSTIFFLDFVEDVRPHLIIFFNFPTHDMGDGVKYLGFNLKPNSYGIFFIGSGCSHGLKGRSTSGATGGSLKGVI
jgi:hypothetical protein